MSIKSLLDGDIIAFSCAVYNEQWGWDQCVEDMDNMIARILETTGSDSYQIYLSGPDNFRYEIDPEYKANRRAKVDPIYREPAKEYLINKYQAKLTLGYEADDALGIGQSESTIICSIDKDLKQVPGRHYNWRRNEFTTVTPIDGIRLFYRQLLMGDRTDNVFGVPGIGEVKSGRIINDLEDEKDMFESVQILYNDDQRLLKNGRLLKIWQKENDLWEFPKFNDTSQ